MSDAVEFVNVASSETVKAGDVLRVTFTEAYSIQLDSGFKAQFDSVYNNIASVGSGLRQITPNSAVAGNSVAVVDCRVTIAKPVSEFVDYLNGLNSWFVRVAKVERLTPTAATQAASTQGAQEREQATQEQQQKQDESNPVTRFIDTLGSAAKIALAVVVGALVLWLLYEWRKK